MMCPTESHFPGFKFLPTIGKYVLEILEDRQNEFTKMWKWKQPSEEETSKFQDSMVNPMRDLDRQKMASTSDLFWGDIQH
jgi:sarcosine oxidase/L-pipecolate oxidase